MACGDLQEIAVTSDDDGVLELAASLGIRHLIERPESLATDTAKSTDVVLHAVTWMSHRSRPPDVLCLLQPTSPLRASQDISAALRVFAEAGGRPVVSVCEAGHPPSWSNTLEAGHSMINFARALEGPQESPATYYRLNGAIYLAHRDEFLTTGRFLTERTVAYAMPRGRSVDVRRRMRHAAGRGAVAAKARGSTASW